MRLEKIGTDRLKEAERISSIAFTYPYNEPAPSEENRSVEDTMLNSERWGMIDEKTDRLMGGMILLSHLSENNNTPQLAYHAVCEELRGEGIRPGEDVYVGLLRQDQPSSVFELECE